jgi:hypothetical protein
MKPFHDGLMIVFSEVSHPDTTFEVKLIDEMRNPCAWRTIGRSPSNEKYGYVARMSKRFVGDKLMNVVRIDYQIEEEGKWEENEVFNGAVIYLHSQAA